MTLLKVTQVIPRQSYSVSLIALFLQHSSLPETAYLFLHVVIVSPLHQAASSVRGALLAV